MSTVLYFSTEKIPQLVTAKFFRPLIVSLSCPGQLRKTLIRYFSRYVIRTYVQYDVLHDVRRRCMNGSIDMYLYVLSFYEDFGSRVK